MTNSKNQNRLSFTSGLMLVIMCAILCAGLCFSIVLFEDHVNTADAFSYTDVDWVNVTTLPNGTTTNTIWLTGYNAIYFHKKANYSYGLMYLGYITNSGSSQGLNVVGSGANFYLTSNTSSTSGGIWAADGFSDSYVLLVPAGLSFMKWSSTDARSKLDVFVGNIVAGGSVDPDEYVTIEEFEQLQADFDALQDDLDELQDIYDTLSQDYLDLQSNYQAVLDMNSDYAANLQQKNSELNLMYNNLSMLVMWVNGVFIGNDEAGTQQYTPEFEEYLESLGYDLDNFLYTDINDVVYDLRPIVRDMRTQYDYYQQFYDDYQELLSQYEYLNGKYNALVDALDFTQIIGSNINNLEGLDGTQLVTLGDKLVMATNNGKVKVRFNMVGTIRAGTEILLTYTIGSSINDLVWYPTVVKDDYHTLFTTVDGSEHTFSYVPTSDVTYFTLESQNTDYTTSSMIVYMTVDARVDDIAGVYDIGYDDGYLDGKDEWYGKGKNDGYQIGYREGKYEDASDPSFTNMIGALVDVPVNALFGKYDVSSQQRVGGLFNFEILGVNLAAFFLSLLSLSIILFIIKFALMK